MSRVQPIEEVYQEILEGKRRTFPYSTWQDESLAVRCTKYLIEEVLQWTDDEIKAKFGQSTLKKYKLYGMLAHVFNSSPYAAINAAYPNKFKPWEFKHVPKDYWTKETGIEATKWLIEEKLQWTELDIKEKLNQKMYAEHGLSGMLQCAFNSSPFEAINATYPNKFQAWELQFVPKNYWTKSTGIKATKWLIEEKLRWSIQDVKDGLDIHVFVKNGLSGMLQHVFDGSPYLAISTTYPGECKPWELQHVPNGFWTKETGIEATKWLIEEKLKWSIQEIKDKLDKKIFIEYGLRGMLQQVFSHSPYTAISAAYPDIFKPWDFKSTSNKYWAEETGIAATKWLIEEHLQWGIREARECLSVAVFRLHGLDGMLQQLYSSSPYLAMEAAYPGTFKPSHFRHKIKG